MKKALRIMGVCILLAISISALWAGGKTQESAGGPVKLNYWTLLTGGDKDYMDAMVAKFVQENPDIQIEPLVAKWENYYDFLTTAIAGGNAPDVCIIHMTYVPVLASKGALFPLDENIKKYNISGSDFLDVPWQRTFYQGKQYAVPLDVHPMIFFYNTKVLRNAGLLDSNGKFAAPSNLDGWLKVFETVKTKTGAVAYNYTGNSTSGMYREWFSYLYQFGGTLLSADNKKAAFNSPEGIAALQLLVDFSRKYKYSQPDLNNQQTLTMFNNDEAAFEGYGVWRTGVFEAGKKDFGAIFYPVLGKQPAFWANSHVFAMPQQRQMDQKKIEASMKFIDWMTNNTIMWTAAGHVPSRKSVINSSAYQAMTNRPFATDLSMLNYVKYAPTTTALDEVENVVIEAVQAAIVAGKDVRQALNDAAQKVDSILK